MLMHADACFTLTEVDPLKHGQPIFDEAASTDLGVYFRRRLGLAAGGPSDTNNPLIMRVGLVIRSHIFVPSLSTHQPGVQGRTYACL